ncbi:hypothetical protein GCM10022280_18930 [Sphingomonas swuensis]|uniref:Uncharacterized protein n=1 Tax=Sphingomonas swuensis TaxID=977800 RepID=A0ABP7T0M1_9SPHN
MLGGAALIAVPASAAELSIWAVPGLYGFENTACKPREGRATAMIAKPLCPVLEGKGQVIAAQQFVASMKRNFPKVVEKFAAQLPNDATPRAKLSSGLIASLRLTRATIWTVNKGTSVDGFLPVTLTLDITNPATGEVVFTRTRSETGEGTFLAATAETEIAASLPAKLSTMIESLVASAARDWHPERQVATVIGRAGDAWVVDRGRANGLRTHDSIGADGRVTFAGPNFAIVQPTLGEYKVGQTLERTSAAPAAVLARPSVLTAIVQVPEGYSPTYLAQTFEDALGAKASLSPMPVNPGFADLRRYAVGEAQMSSSDDRPLPDYVAAVSIVHLPSGRIASNIPGVSIERHAAAVFVSLIDRTGRVVHSVQGMGRIQDEVSRDMRFSAEQRRETVIRNALLDAAAKLATFKPKNLELSVAVDGKSISIVDPQGALPLGQEVTVLRSAGRVGSVDRVYFPVGRLRTSEIMPGGVSARPDDVEPAALRKGDLVNVEYTGSGLAWRRTVGRCLEALIPRLDDRGSNPVPVASSAADAFFSANYAAPVRRWDVPPALSDLKADFANWSRFVPAGTFTADRCYVPVIAVTPDAKTRGYSLLAGYTLFEGATKITGSGLQANLTPTLIPPGTPADQAKAILDQDVALALLPLMERAAKSLNSAR